MVHHVRRFIVALLIVVLVCSVALNIDLWFSRKNVAPEKGLLTQALQLLPDPDAALAWNKLSDHLYWVWVKKSYQDEEWKNEDQSWVIDTEKGIARLAKTQTFGVPYGPTVSHNDPSEYFPVLWTGGWEGIDFDVKDYFDQKTGDLVYSLKLENGRLATVETKDKRLSIALDPPGGCESNVTAPLRTVRVTGLKVNDVQIPFPAPRIVTCQPNEMLGSGFYPPFRFLISSAEQTATLAMPWTYEEAVIPLSDLRPETIKLNRTTTIKASED